MDLEQLSGRYRRLKDELAALHGQQPAPEGRIERLTEEIAETERAIAALGIKTSPRSGTRLALPTPSIARHRLTPFGQRAGGESATE